MIKCGVTFSSNTIKRRGFYRITHKRPRQADGEIGVEVSARNTAWAAEGPAALLATAGEDVDSPSSGCP